MTVIGNLKDVEAVNRLIPDILPDDPIIKAALMARAKALWSDVECGECQLRSQGNGRCCLREAWERSNLPRIAAG
jgi:hypothetical protein